MAAAALPLFALALPASAAKYTVVVSQMKFGALPAHLRVGDVIVWDNRDYVPHSATARNGDFDVELPARATQAQMLKTAGDFAFFCKYHTGMTGDMQVGKAAAKTAKAAGK